MTHHRLLFALFACGLTSAVCGQFLPETNNKIHYDDRTARQEIAVLYRKVKAGYAFDKIARKYSQDYGSYEIGGALGWQKQQQFLPIYSKVIAQLAKGHFSKPFKSEFGYHIVQVLGRKDEDVLTRHVLLRVDG